MMQRIMKNNNKKGFTLVELIVVMIILVILAAILIPTLTGYIDKAKERSVIAETRQAVMAAQTLADEDYAAGDTTYASVTATKIKDLGDLKASVEITNPTIDASGKITQLVLKDGKTCTYTPNGGYVVSK